MIQHKTKYCDVAIKEDEGRYWIIFSGSLGMEIELNLYPNDEAIDILVAWYVDQLAECLTR